MSDSIQVPDFDDLPKVPGMPQGCAWGVFDKSKEATGKDVFGCLNFLTPSVVKQAAAEVKDGVHISLNWSLGAIKSPGFGRKGLVHTVIDHMDTPVHAHGYDDEVEFNTQESSQWDSLCHYHHQPSASGYNGAKTNAHALTQDFGARASADRLPTLDHWHSRGGLVARGVLIDYRRYAEKAGLSFNCFDADRITVQDLEKVAAAQGVDFRQGDVLIIRSGFTEELGGLDADGQSKAMGSHRMCGVEGTDEAARWFWNQRFSAVAGDMIAFEQVPATDAAGKELGIDGLG